MLAAKEEIASLNKKIQGLGSDEIFHIRQEVAGLYEKIHDLETAFEAKLKKAHKTIQNLSDLLSEVDNKIDARVNRREQNLLNDLYRFRVFRWRISGSVGDVGYIRLINLNAILDIDSSGLNCHSRGSSLRYKSIHMKQLNLSYLDLLEDEKPLDTSNGEIHIPSASPIVFLRFHTPTQVKLLKYNIPYIQPSGYNHSGLPKEWILEGSNDEKTWITLSEGKYNAGIRPSGLNEEMINLRTSAH